MDKEQAIDLLDNLIGMIEDNQGNDYDVAFRMAIEALKAQLFSEGTTKDTISRQAAIGCLRDGQICGDYCRKAIEQLPPVQPERKKGEWIEISSINHTYKCSECGRLLVNVADGRNNVSKHYPYCHCGADMKGGSNE